MPNKAIPCVHAGGICGAFRPTKTTSGNHVHATCRCEKTTSNKDRTHDVPLLSPAGICRKPRGEERYQYHHHQIIDLPSLACLRMSECLLRRTRRAGQLVRVNFAEGGRVCCDCRMNWTKGAMRVARCVAWTVDIFLSP